MKIEENRNVSGGLYKTTGLKLDGRDYHILYDAAQMIKGVEGFTCEIGVREGGATALIIQACIDNDDKRIHVGIDPYGNIETFHSMLGNEEKMRHDWNDSMMINTLPLIYKFCKELNVKFLFFNMEDDEFFKRFSDGIPVYDQYKVIVNKYALVFFDAPSTLNGAIKIKEAEWFLSRTPIGGMWVFDDIGDGDNHIHAYKHGSLNDKLINEWGFEIVDKEWKWSYKKVK